MFLLARWPPYRRQEIKTELYNEIHYTKSYLVRNFAFRKTVYVCIYIYICHMRFQIIKTNNLLSIK